MVMITVFGQVALSQTPHLQGELSVSVTAGTIDGDITLTNYPKDNSLNLWLNSGLNIEYFRDTTDRYNFTFKKEYNAEHYPEVLQYYSPTKEGEYRSLPNAINIKYTGKFSVIQDTSRAYKRGDWKGNIAFNGQTLRASEQSAWYPILYDRDKDIIYDKVTYDLTVSCNDCNALYLNGDLPVKESAAQLRSTEAVPLLIFVGNYDFNKSGQTYILNSGMGERKQHLLASINKSMISFYEQKLDVNYGKPVVYISTSPVSKRNEWMFVSYPTITVVGIDKYKLENYIHDSLPQFSENVYFAYIAHELAHYYVGTRFVPNNELRWFFLEGLTDYLSLQATKNLLGKAPYQTIINNYINAVQHFEVTPISSVTDASQISEIYRY